mgnify:CR=1 FL=1
MKNKENENKKNKKHIIGRNPLTILIFTLGAVVLFFLIYIPYSYISTRLKASPTPFVTNVTSTMKTNVGVTDTSTSSTTTAKSTKILTEMTDEAITMKGKDFDVLDINFYAQTYDQAKGSATFHCDLTWNANTTALIPNKAMTTLSSSYTTYVYVCLSAPWVYVNDSAFAEYSSLQYFTLKAPVSTTTTDDDGNEVTTTPEKGDTYTRESISVSGLGNFPYRTSLWTETFPTIVCVDAPTAYVYIYFKYKDDDNNEVSKRYILEYEYNDYHTNSTVGGIEY